MHDLSSQYSDADLGEVKRDKSEDAKGGQDDSQSGCVMLAPLRQGSRQEAALSHAQQLKAVAAHLRLKLPYLTNGCSSHHPPREPPPTNLQSNEDVATPCMHRSRRRNASKRLQDAWGPTEASIELHFAAPMQESIIPCSGLQKIMNTCISAVAPGYLRSL